MMIDSEKLVDKALREKIKGYGGWSIKLLATHVTGLPDRLCLLPRGHIFFGEIKTTNKKPTKIQLFIHKKLMDLGFEVFIFDKVDETKKLVDNYCELRNIC